MKRRKISVMCLNCNTVTDVFGDDDSIYKDEDGEYKTFAWCPNCLTTRNCRVLNMEFVFR